jgi:hypothetical protein
VGYDEEGAVVKKMFPNGIQSSDQTS